MMQSSGAYARIHLVRSTLHCARRAPRHIGRVWLQHNGAGPYSGDDQGRGSFFEWVNLSPMTVESLDSVWFLKLKREFHHTGVFEFDVSIEC